VDNYKDGEMAMVDKSKTSEEIKQLEMIKKFYKQYFNQDISEDIEDAYVWAFTQTDKLQVISWLIHGYKAGYSAAIKQVQ
jgi:hypothetical protein